MLCKDESLELAPTPWKDPRMPVRPVPDREQYPCPSHEMMWGYAQGSSKMEEFRINPRLQIWVMGKMVSSIKYK